jgi:hydroxymethylbilane synthase
VKPLRIGTRRSRLALVQAEIVCAALAARDVATEIVPMTTSGDEGAAAVSSPQGLKGLWIDTILDALESREIDVAVHSAKDLPAEDEGGFVIAAVPLRTHPLDVLITRAKTLPSGAVVGTSSLRRQSQLLASFPGLKVTAFRGNVDTRLRKLDGGEVDATVLAEAGLVRLGLTHPHARTLSLKQMVPAPGQGCLAIQCRDDDDTALQTLTPLDDPASHRAFDVERSLMWRVGGGCALPLGAFAKIMPKGAVHLTALVATPDGDRVIRVEEEGTDDEAVAGQAASALIAGGAEEILAEVRGT